MIYIRQQAEAKKKKKNIGLHPAPPRPSILEWAKEALRLHHNRKVCRAVSEQLQWLESVAMPILLLLFFIPAQAEREKLAILNSENSASGGHFRNHPATMLL